MGIHLRLVRFAAPCKVRIALAIPCMVVLSLATAASANLLGPALEFLFTGRVEALGALRNFAPDGRVVETGSHDELVARGGEYARLYRVYEGEEAGEARAAAAHA